MKKGHSLMRCFAGIVAAAVSVSAFSGCGISTAYPEVQNVLPEVSETSANEFEYKYSAEREGMIITAYLGQSPKVHIPDTIEGEPVITADLGDAEITHLIMPATLIDLKCNNQYIKYANYPNSNIDLGESLEEVYIEPTVDGIGDEAFENCTGLTTVIIPEGVASIGDKAFYNCTNLASVFIPGSVTSIGDYAFYNCESLTSVNLPHQMKDIGNEAFHNCKSLTSIVIPEGITQLKGTYGTFAGCSNLSSVTIANTVTEIGWNSFSGCTSLTSVTIPNNVVTIERFAFDNCTNLTSVSLPDNISYIDDGAFQGCENLTNILYHGETYESTQALYDAIEYPDGYIVENGVFKKCPAYYKGEFVIPDGVTSITGSAFSDCASLVSIIIPDSVTSISEYALYNCQNISKITYKGNTYSYENIGQYRTKPVD